MAGFFVVGVIGVGGSDSIGTQSSLNQSGSTREKVEKVDNRLFPWHSVELFYFGLVNSSPEASNPESSNSETQRPRSDSFAFGTKAETLSQLQGRLTRGKLLPQQTITVARWKQDQETVLAEIQRRFPGQQLAVRSSSQLEDSQAESQAGVFTSVLNVAANHSQELRIAIERVLSSFQRDRRASDEDQILIQPQLQEVVRAGVAFSRDLQSGSPYYVIKAAHGFRNTRVYAVIGSTVRLHLGSFSERRSRCWNGRKASFATRTPVS